MERISGVGALYENPKTRTTQKEKTNVIYVEGSGIGSIYNVAVNYLSPKTLSGDLESKGENRPYDDREVDEILNPTPVSRRSEGGFTLVNGGNGVARNSKQPLKEKDLFKEGLENFLITLNEDIKDYRDSDLVFLNRFTGRLKDYNEYRKMFDRKDLLKKEEITLKAGIEKQKKVANKGPKQKLILQNTKIELKLLQGRLKKIDDARKTFSLINILTPSLKESLDELKDLQNKYELANNFLKSRLRISPLKNKIEKRLAPILDETYNQLLKVMVFGIDRKSHFSTEVKKIRWGNQIREICDFARKFGPSHQLFRLNALEESLSNGQKL